MYVKPQVERFGTFRQLTLLGFSGNCDGYSAVSNTDGVASDGSNSGIATGSTACMARS